MAHRYSALFLFVATTASMFGQAFTLTYNEQLPPGSDYTMRVIQNIAAVDTTPGQNMIWDHSTLVPTGVELDVNVLVSSASPYASSFPSANFCLYESSIPRYSYFENTPASNSRIGFWRDELGTYSDAQTELVYPVTYGASNSDTWANNTVTFPGTYEYSVIGTGSLVLPSGSWDDVILLRIKVVNVFEYIQYTWLSASNGAYLLIYNAPSFFGGATGQMLTSLNVGIEESTAGMDFRLHAPGNGQLPLTYTTAQATTYRIMDTAGRLVTTGRLTVNAAPRTDLLDISMVRSGLHIIELNSSAEHRALRFFVE